MNSVTAAPASGGNAEAATNQWLVIGASSLGTVFEWYDFYLYGLLASILTTQFFSGVNETTGFIFALAAFAAGFAVRPFGALVFGRLGDLVGRKHTFLITMSIMGGATFAVGILPNYASIGVTAPIALLALRLLQGLALGGEYGGAATYVAEHAPPGKRGFYTSWIQTTATFGLFAALLVVIGTRTWMGEDAFKVWGWRIPFIVSVVLLGVSLWIRMQLSESPVFLKMKSAGTTSRAPLREAFGNWSNLKIVLVSLAGAVMGQAVVWYCGQFYALFFLERTLRVDGATTNILTAIALCLATPCFVLFGWLSDKIGRKPIILAGCSARGADVFPAVPRADPVRQSGVVRRSGVRAGDRHRRSIAMFVPIRSHRQEQIRLDVVRYRQELSRQGGRLLRAGRCCAGSGGANSHRRRHADRPDPRALRSVRNARRRSPSSRARPRRSSLPPRRLSGQGRSRQRVNKPMVVLILFVLVLYVTMVYGPIAALLVELFPARIRYSAMSLPYHIGNGWFGGFLPTTAFAMVAATGNLYYGLWYPDRGRRATVVIGFFFLPETFRRQGD